MNLKERIEQSFSTYAAMTIQHRAMLDARDCLKPALRMAMYAQYLDKLTYDKPYRKTHVSITAAMAHFYVHGDSSMCDLLCRAASPISMRYPIEASIGNMGTYSGLDDHAAPRYTEMKLGAVATSMLNGIKQNTIDTWFDNFDNTEQFPAVLPSLGYYNIVNGTTGIATGIASSIPQFNLREVNEAMIKLLWNPEIDFDEIYCAPDFATGGTILNANEVKESLRVGRGKSAIIRGTVEYNAEKNILEVKEVPYGVATSRIKKEMGKMFNPNPEDKKQIPSTAIVGIERFEDSSEEIVDFTVWLSKGAVPTSVVRNLYKYTSIQSHFPINMTMLKDGTRPAVFGWKEALQAHLDHEIIVRKRMHEFDIKKIDERLPIVDAIVLALANVDEVISIIRNSNNAASARTKLMERFGYNEAQAKAVVDIKLGRLANLEVQSFKDEREKLTKDRDYHVLALNDKNTLYKEIEKDLKEVANKFGDERRTRLMNLNYKNDEEDAEPIEKKELLIHFTNLGNIYTQESTTLMTSRRGGKGTKVKLANNEAIVQTLNDTNFSSLLVFSNKGKMYSLSIDDLPVNSKVNVAQFFEFEVGEHITTATSIARKSQVKYFTFITKNGMIKKTKATEYEHRRGKSLKAINLKDDDEVISVHFVNDEKVGILTSEGNFVIIETEEINSIGRATAGIKAIKLGTDDKVISSHIICQKDNMLVTISRGGLTKKTSLEEFPVCNRGIKGRKISGTRDNDFIVDFLTLSEDCDIISISNKGTIKFNTSELRNLSRDATGVKAITLNDGDYVVNLIQG